jgi:hypothetical protein
MNNLKMNNDFDSIRARIAKSFVKKDENVFHAQKLFMAVSVLRWAYEKQASESEKSKYYNFVEKYLDGEIDLYWEDGIIKLKTLTKSKRAKNDS